MSASEPLKNQSDGKKPVSRSQAIEVSALQARLLLLGVGATVFVLANLPSDPETPILLGMDKLNHLAAFAVLTLLTLVSWPRAPRWRLVLGLIGYGVLIELVQGLSGWGRTASVADVIADLVGIGLGLLTCSLLTHWRKRRSGAPS